MTAREAMGPLVVSKANPRYFAVASRDADAKVVYLTGSHIWNNFHDGMGPGAECADDARSRTTTTPISTFLKEHGHNFIRLWRWEQFQSQAAGGGFHLCMTPQPWPRTGPRNGEGRQAEVRPRRASTRPTSTGCASA